MAGPETLRVEVVYARSDRQHLAVVEVPAGTSVLEAVQQSGLLTRCPEINLAECQFGVFGRVLSPDKVVRNGERVEIYRALRADPKDARRQRARKPVCERH